MSLSGKVALWVMTAAGFERKEEHDGKKKKKNCDISGSAVSIVCFKLVQQCYRSATLRVDSFSKPGVYITHNATLSHWGDITGRNLSDYMQLPRKPPSNTPHDVSTYFDIQKMAALPFKCSNTRLQ